jgi:hypothetical protein
MACLLVNQLFNGDKELSEAIILIPMKIISLAAKTANI